MRNMFANHLAILGLNRAHDWLLRNSPEIHRIAALRVIEAHILEHPDKWVYYEEYETRSLYVNNCYVCKELKLIFARDFRWKQWLIDLIDQRGLREPPGWPQRLKRLFEALTEARHERERVEEKQRSIEASKAIVARVKEIVTSDPPWWNNETKTVDMSPVSRLEDGKVVPVELPKLEDHFKPSIEDNVTTVQKAAALLQAVQAEQERKAVQRRQSTIARTKVCKRVARKKRLVAIGF